MSDIGKGDWVECINDASDEPLFSLQKGHVYFVAGFGLTMKCRHCRNVCTFVRLANEVGAVCPTRLLPLSGRSHKHDIHAMPHPKAASLLIR